MELLDLFQRLGLAAAIGFAVGVERGWKQRFEEDESRVAGLRTYTLIGLLGGVAGLIGLTLDAVAFAALALAFGAALTLYKLWETWRDGDISITGLIGALLVFALGAYAAIGNMQAAAAGGVFVVIVLAFKDALHAWIRALSWEEIRSALLILAATLIALPLLPERALDPYGAFNPRELWLLTILLSGASFAGYVALRVFGPRAGLYVGALAGAVVSSTAVTVDLARRNKNRESPHLQTAAVAAFANLVMFGRVAALLALFAPGLLRIAGAPLIGACLATIAAVALLALASHRRESVQSSAPQRSPLDVKAVLRLALVLGSIIVAARLIGHFYGDAGLFVFAATAGLVDVDAVALAVSGMMRTGLGAEAGAGAVLLAVGVDTVSKAALAAFIGHWRFSLAYAGASLAALAAGAGVYFVAAGAP